MSALVGAAAGAAFLAGTLVEGYFVAAGADGVFLAGTRPAGLGAAFGAAGAPGSATGGTACRSAVDLLVGRASRSGLLSPVTTSTATVAAARVTWPMIILPMAAVSFVRSIGCSTDPSAYFVSLTSGVVSAM